MAGQPLALMPPGSGLSQTAASSALSSLQQGQQQPGSSAGPGNANGTNGMGDLPFSRSSAAAPLPGMSGGGENKGESKKGGLHGCLDFGTHFFTQFEPCRQVWALGAAG